MLMYVKLTNFRGLDGRYDFQNPEDGDASPRVQLRGQNGARKTTIREAIAFAFTGRDSLGTARPAHVITLGEEECEVEVMTRKGTIIKRALPRKGGGTLQMAMPGGPLQSLSQTDFEAMLCPADVFLSVFVPGYLLGHLNKNRQAAVLSYILPPVDRRATLARILGVPAEETMDLDFSRRPDLLKKDVMEERNLLDFNVARLRGEENSILQQLDSRPPEPMPPPELALVGLQEQLQREWAQYESESVRYRNHLHDIRIKREENERIIRQRASAEAELARLREIPLPARPEPFTLEKPEKPAEPFFQNEEERDRCPACGQAVGLKHREMVRAQNEKTLATYSEAREAWNMRRKDWERLKAEHSAMVWAYEKQEKEIGAANEKVQARRAQLDWALRTRLVPHTIPENEPLPPKKPAEEFSTERYLEMRRIVEGYHRALGAFESWQEIKRTGEARLRELSETIASMEAKIQRLRALGEALRVLPNYELMEQRAHLALPDGYELRVEEGVELFNAHGCPYELLSRGERMHADFQVSLKVNALLRRKVAMIFLDDFDLADWSELLKEAPDTVQIFTAHVWAGGLTVGLSN